LCHSLISVSDFHQRWDAMAQQENGVKKKGENMKRIIIKDMYIPLSIIHL